MTSSILQQQQQQQQQQLLIDDMRRYGLKHISLARASIAAQDGTCVAWLATRYFGTFCKI